MGRSVPASSPPAHGSRSGKVCVTNEEAVAKRLRPSAVNEPESASAQNTRQIGQRVGVSAIRILLVANLCTFAMLLVGLSLGYRPHGGSVVGQDIRLLLEPIVLGAFSLVVIAGTATALVKLWQQDKQVTSAATARVSRAGLFGRPIGLRSPIVIIPIVAAVLLLGGVASALFTGSDTISSNVFGTGCFDAQVSTVQSGEVANVAEGVQAVTITSVDPARSVVFVSLRSASDEPADSMVLAELASATELQFTRRTDDATPPAINVAWTVVEYGCGVTVQRGSNAGNGLGSMDVTISSAQTATSYVVTSAVTDRADAAHDGDDDHVATLVDATTLRLTAASGGALPANHSYGWQVVTFDDPADVSVQVEATTLSATNSETITLATAVDPSTTMVLASAASAGSGADIGERMVRVHLSSANTVEVTRLLSGDPIDVSVQVVDFGDGTVVQHGILNMNAATAAASVSVSPVDTTRASALSTVNVPGSVSGGATDMSASAQVGEGSATFTLADPATVSVERSASTAAASFGWQLVEWGGPAWWDAAYPFRQRIDVTTTSTAAPDGYTVPLTIDHLDLLNSGLSQNSGDDLRVLRWDGSAWTELDRVLDDGDSWGSASTTIWFRTTDAIDAASTDSYWLYFGNQSPAAPAADPEMVWLLHEDFESGTLGDFEDRTSGTSWYQAEPWSHRIPVAVQASQVDQDLLDFPVYVELTNSQLGTEAAADGADIRFTEDDGTTPIPHELESWDPGTGTIKAWIRMPVVSSSVNTTVYLYFGAADSPDRQSAVDVWRHSSGVWHLDRDPGGVAPQIDDVSIAQHDGLSTGGMAPADLVAGRTGQGADLDGVDDRFVVEPFDVAGKTITASGWVKLDSISGDQLIVGKAASASDRILTLGTSGSQAELELRTESTTHTVNGGTIVAGTWHHIAGTWNGTTLSLYVDGVSVATAAASGVLDADGTMPVTLGGLDSGERPLDGVLDEVRVETVTRHVEWLLASVRNQSNPATFLQAGAVETGTWFDQGSWSYRKPLAVNGNAVDATLSDQPVLVDVVDAELAGNIQADGDDLVFTAGDGTTRLDHELESVNATTGAVVAWVRLPTVDASADTSFFVYYGNSSAENQQDLGAVFGPDADLVVHGS